MVATLRTYKKTHPGRAAASCGLGRQQARGEEESRAELAARESVLGAAGGREAGLQDVSEAAGGRAGRARRKSRAEGRRAWGARPVRARSVGRARVEGDGGADESAAGRVEGRSRERRHGAATMRAAVQSG